MLITSAAPGAIGRWLGQLVRRSGRAILILALIAVCAPPRARAAEDSDERWRGGFTLPGLSGNVYALAQVGDDTYAAGDFAIASAAIVGHIARWDGVAWHALGAGLAGPAYSMVAQGDDLYVAGGFAAAGGVAGTRGIARWDGRAWHALGTGLAGGDEPQISALLLDGADLYAAGSFASIGGVAAANIARWDGAAWHALGAGLGRADFGFHVRSLALHADEIYAGGFFAAGAAANLARWDGAAWHAVGDPALDQVDAVGSCAGELYVVGPRFSGATGESPSLLLRRTPAGSWESVANLGLEGLASQLLSRNDELYIALVARAADTPLGGPALARWDGAALSAVIGDIPAGVRAMLVSTTAITVGGTFSSVGGVPAQGVAAWRPAASVWQALRAPDFGGLDGPVQALAVYRGDLYVGGRFRSAGGVPSPGLARWDGQGWAAVGGGLGGAEPPEVRALVVYRDTLVVGGRFGQAGEVGANSLATWDGASWAALGAGVRRGSGLATVSALAVFADALYAGGDFDTPQQRLARWDAPAGAWLPVGGGAAVGDVLAMGVFGDHLIVGGSFQGVRATPGGPSLAETRGIVRWDGAAWGTLDGGLAAGQVRALAVLSDTLYVGGSFGGAGGESSPGLLRWDGQSWAAPAPLARPGSAAGPVVSALAVVGAELYAAGSFSQAGGAPAANVARLRGDAWSTLGSGLNAGAAALAAYGERLYVGGDLTVAGGNVSAYLAAYDLVVAPPALSVSSPANNLLQNRAAVTMAGSATPGSAVVVREGAAQRCAAQSAADGAWGCSFNLPDGSHTLTVHATRLGVSGATLTRSIRIDTSAPARPTIALVGGAPGGALRRGLPVLGGTAERGSTLTLLIMSSEVGQAAAPIVTYQIRIGNSGGWRIDTSSAPPLSGAMPAKGLPPGRYTLSVQSSDAAGNQSSSASLPLQVNRLLLLPLLRR